MKLVKQLSQIAAMALMAMAFAACTSDKLQEPEGDTPGGSSSHYSGDKILLTFDMQMPAGTRSRSQTDDQGGSSGDSNGAHKTEPGTSNESTIRKFVVTFYKKEGDIWKTDSKYTFDNGTVEQSEISGCQKVKFEMSLDVLKELAGDEVRIRLAANGAGGSGIDEERLTLGADLTKPPFGEYNNVSMPLMNKYEFVVDLTGLAGSTDAEFMENLTKLFKDDPADRTIDLSNTNIETGEKLAAPRIMTLERGMARVDYKPKGWSKENTDNRQIFPVGEINNLYAEMYSLQVINVSQHSWLFRKVKAGNRDGVYDNGLVEVLGKENANENFWKPDEDLESIDGANNPDFKWVMDADWYTSGDASNELTKYDFFEASKTPGWSGPFTDGKPYFLNQPVMDDGPIYTVKGTDYQKEVYYADFKDDYGRTADANGYFPLWYMSENTLPSTESMINGLSTGIAFKMVLCKSDGTPLQPNSDDSDDFFTNDFFTEGEAAYQSRLQDLTNQLDQASSEDKSGIQADIDALKAKIVGSLKPSSDYDGLYELQIGSQKRYVEKISNVDVSKTDGTGTEKKDVYVITYYYFFRHNIDKDHKLGTVLPMQFAVVRNNVYKVSVTALNGLPEPYDPSKHDEPQENVIAVETLILSWAMVDQPEINL